MSGVFASGVFAAGPLPVEARAALALQLRSAGVRDVSVMRAIERVPRELFAPHRYRDLSNRNIALPLDCGQTLPAPAGLGRWLEALAAGPQHRVLEVGAGSGYSTAVLAQIAREAVSIERYEALAIEARERLAALSVDNARVLFGDGLAPDRSLGLFDRIVLYMAFEEPPAAALELLAAGGAMVYGWFPPRQAGRRRARIMRLERGADGALRAPKDCGECREGAAVSGKAPAL